MNDRFCPVCEHRSRILDDPTCRLCWRAVPIELKRELGAAVQVYRASPSSENRARLSTAQQAAIDAARAALTLPTPTRTP